MKGTGAKMKKRKEKTIKFTVIKQGKKLRDSDLIYSCCRKSQRGLPGNP